MNYFYANAVPKQGAHLFVLKIMRVSRHYTSAEIGLDLVWPLPNCLKLKDTEKADRERAQKGS